LFFLDYIGTGKLRPDIVADIVEGLSLACKESGMPLIGGETAEMPDLYGPGEYDLAGFIVGVVDRQRIINGSKICEGDICLGLPSTGLHTNGYSLARKVAFEIAGHKPDDCVKELGGTVAEALMAIHRCYAPVVLPLLDKFKVHGMAHITGGGIQGNLNRVMPSGLCAEISKSTWPVPPVFSWLKEAGNIDPVDIYRTFNMGIGYILVTNGDEAAGIKGTLEKLGETCYEIGRVVKGSKPVKLTD